MYVLSPVPPKYVAEELPPVDFLCAETAWLRSSASYCDHILAQRKPVLVQSHWPENTESLLRASVEIRYPIVLLVGNPRDMIEKFREQYPRGTHAEFCRPRYALVATGDTWAEFWETYQEVMAMSPALIAIPPNITFVPPDGDEDEPQPLPDDPPQLAAARRRYRVIQHLQNAVKVLGRGWVKNHLMGVVHPMELALYRKVNQFVFSAHTNLALMAACQKLSLVSGGEDFYGGASLNPPMWWNEVMMGGDHESLDRDALRLFKQNLKALYTICNTGRSPVRK